MKIYMDVCCFNRPYDDQGQDRIRLEAEAVMAILYNCQKGHWSLVGSDIIDFELGKTQNPIKKLKATILADMAITKIKFNENIQTISTEYQNAGIDLFDSLHIACVEESGANIMLTTDDKLIKKAKNLNKIKVIIENPVKWFMEVTSDEYND